MQAINYIILVLGIALLVSCAETPLDSPTEIRENSGIVAKVQKWDTDIYTTKKSNLLEEILYNIEGDVLRSTVYNPETGDLDREAVYTYSDDSSIEIERVYVDGVGEQRFRNEYQYNNQGQVEKKISYEQNGDLISVEDYEYDSSGNLLKTIVINEDDTKAFDYLYTFDDSGHITSREVTFESEVLQRDSMYRNTDQFMLEVFTFDGGNELKHSLTYRHNTNGDITSVVCTGPSGEIVFRHIYQYVYHK